MDIKLTLDQNAPIGTGFDYYIRCMDCTLIDVKELKALLLYRNQTMISLNKTRALSAIDCAMESLKELRATIEEC